MDPRAAELVASLRRNPDDRIAYQALHDHYARMGDYASLTNLVEGWAGKLTNGKEAGRAFVEAADLAYAQLRDTRRAGKLFDLALKKSPRSGRIVEHCLHFAESSGDSARLLDILRHRGGLQKRSQDVRGLADTEHRIGQLYEHHYGRPDKAIAHYRKAFDADPNLIAAIYAAREIYLSAGNHRAAATLLELEAKAESNLERKVQLLRELAQLKTHDLGDNDGAIVALQTAMHEAPADLAVKHELSTAFLARAGDQENAKAQQDRAQAADLMVDMARAVHPEHGLAYCCSALDSAPGHEDAMEHLEYLVVQTGREDLLPARWVAYLQAAPDAPGAMPRRRKLGFAYLDAGQEADALICLEPLLEAGDVEVASLLVDMFRNAGRLSDALRALQVSASALPPEERAARLHGLIDGLIAEDRVDEAVQCSIDLLAIAPDDMRAFVYLRDHFRQAQAWEALRDLLTTASRAPGLDVSGAIERLHESATLSEQQLGDLGAAIEAYRSIAALDDSDTNASKAITRLLGEAARWDELATHLERLANVVQDADATIAVLRKLAKLHRVEREDPRQSVVALRRILQLRPTDDEARDLLCDALLKTDEGVLEATMLLEDKIREAEDSESQIALLSLLGDTLEERLSDDDRAFEAARQLLDLDAQNLSALDRMERIDERAQDYDRLARTLTYRSELLSGDERADVLARVGEIARDHLSDLERAASCFDQALDASPGRVELLTALCDVYERDGKYEQLLRVLRGRVESQKDAAGAQELQRRIARLLATQLDDSEGSLNAWRALLELAEDEEALRALAADARQRDAGDELEGLLARLERCCDEAGAQREVIFERAQVLVKLERTPEAITALRHLLDDVDTHCLAAMKLLTTYCENENDSLGIADALERRLAELEDPGMREPLAMRLADICENDLSDVARAVAALFLWQEANPADMMPRRRLVPLLTSLGRREELVSCLDGLAQLESDPDAKHAFVRESAYVCAELGDVEGAWTRLEPRIDEDTEADQQLAELARTHDRLGALVELYTARAGRATLDNEAKRRWTDASDIYEEMGQDANALEARLRAFATDLEDEATLDEVDRLAAKCDAWTRLSQVYDKLVRAQSDAGAQTRLLLRQATMLEELAVEPSEALDRVLRACSLSPGDDELLERAETLATRVGRGDELLHVYDIRKSKAKTDDVRVDAILRAVRLAYGGMKDMDRVRHYLAQATALTLRTPSLVEIVHDTVERLDDSTQATTLLVDLYAQLGNDAEDNPVAGAELLRRAAALCETGLGDAERAWTLLCQASALAAQAPVLDPLEALAAKLGRREQLNEHYRELIHEAVDAEAVATLCARRGRLLDGPLNRPAEAADAYRRLIAVKRDDESVLRYISCLRRGGEHQQLLVTLSGELSKAGDPETRLLFLRESALVWQYDLNNRYEAMDAWKKLLKDDPDNEEATKALAVLKANEDPDLHQPAEGLVRAGDDLAAPAMSTATAGVDLDAPLSLPRDSELPGELSDHALEIDAEPASFESVQLDEFEDVGDDSDLADVFSPPAGTSSVPAVTSSVGPAPVFEQVVMPNDIDEPVDSFAEFGGLREAYTETTTAAEFLEAEQFEVAGPDSMYEPFEEIEPSAAESGFVAESIDDIALESMSAEVIALESEEISIDEAPVEFAPLATGGQGTNQLDMGDLELIEPSTLLESAHVEVDVSGVEALEPFEMMGDIDALDDAEHVMVDEDLEEELEEFEEFEEFEEIVVEEPPAKRKVSMPPPPPPRASMPPPLPKK